MSLAALNRSWIHILNVQYGPEIHPGGVAIVQSLVPGGRYRARTSLCAKLLQATRLKVHSSDLVGTGLHNASQQLLDPIKLSQHNVESH